MRRFGLLVLLTAIIGSAAHAQTIPYSNDFSGTGDNVDFPNENVSGTGSWTVGNGVYTYTQTGSGSQGSHAVLDLGPDLSNPGSFRFSTQFKVLTLTGSGANANTIGFILNSNTSNPFGNSGNWYNAALNVRQDSTASAVGDLSFGGIGTGSFTSSTIGETGLSTANMLGTTYTLVLEGTRTASSLNLTLSLFDADGTTQIGESATAIDNAGILTGQFSGLRFRGVMSGTQTAEFDNFNVTVPEPGSLALLAPAGLLAVRRRRSDRRPQ